MARKIKVDNAILKKLKRQKDKDRIEFKKIRRFILIVCEGEKTEPLYFEAKKKKLPKAVIETTLTKVLGTGSNTTQVVELAQKEIEKAKQNRNKEYDQVWIVIDRDSFPSQNFNDAIFKCQAVGFDITWSNEAFELWYVLHYQYRNTPMSRDDYKKVLEKEISSKLSKETAFKYQKNDSKFYDVLQKTGDEDFAINNAKKLVANFKDTRYANHNPCTMVYALVEKLNSLIDDYNEDEKI